MASVNYNSCDKFINQAFGLQHTYNTTFQIFLYIFLMLDIIRLLQMS